MKYIKILAILVGVLGMASCQPKDEEPKLNSKGGVTVEFSQSEISFLESKGIVRVPVKVTGDLNGYVTVTAELDEVTDNPNYEPAFDEAHYLLTSSTVNISEEDKTSYFELKLLDDRIINKTRAFTITLKTAQGATIGNPSSCTVLIDDNDDKPYDRLEGTWYMPCEYGGAQTVRTVTLSAWDPDHWAYGYSFQLWGIVGENTPISADEDSDDERESRGAWPILTMFSYNEVTKEGALRIKLGQTIGSATLSDKSKTAIDLYGLTDDFYIVTSGDITLTWNEDVTELYITSSPMGDHANLAGVYIADNSLYLASSYTLNITTLYREMPKQ